MPEERTFESKGRVRVGWGRVQKRKTVVGCVWGWK
jgi:hypothetical protein